MFTFILLHKTELKNKNLHKTIRKNPISYLLNPKRSSFHFNSHFASLQDSAEFQFSSAQLSSLNIRKVLIPTINKNFMYFLAFFFYLSSLIFTLGTATYYVDATNGDDSNSGLSMTNPWKTIAKVNNTQFLPGDNILFKRGEVWRESLIVSSSGIPGKVINFGSFGFGNKPKFIGSIPGGFNKSWIQELDKIWYYENIQYDPHKIFISGIQGKKVSIKSDLKSEEEWWYDNENKRLYYYSSVNPTDLEVEIPLRGPLILIQKNNILIENIEVIYSKTFGIQIWYPGKNVSVVNCSVHDVSLAGILVGKTSNINLNNNEVYNCGAGSTPNNNINGISLDNVNNSTIVNNLIHDNWNYGINIFSSSNYVIVENNKVLNNGKGNLGVGSGIGFYSDNDNNSSQVGNICRYNSIRNEKYNCIFITNNIIGLQVYYNLLVNPGNSIDCYGACIWIGYQAGIKSTELLEIYNNTMYVENNKSTIGCIVAQKNAKLEDAKIKNNIFYVSGDQNYTYKMPNKNIIEPDMDYNVHYMPKNNFGIMWEGSNNITFRQLQNSYKKEKYGIILNPEFVDNLGDFNLLPSSPCIDAGENINISKDIQGNQVIKGEVDIGAFEYQTMTVPKNFRLLNP